MPNWCNFAIKVKGNPKDVEAFCRIMENSALDRPVFTKPYLPRVFEAEHVAGTEADSAIFQGMCAWSVHSSMMNYADSCSITTRAEAKDSSHSGITNLPELAGKLHLDMEVFSAEFGGMFAEYYNITRNGVIWEALDEPLKDYPEGAGDREQSDFDPTDGIVFKPKVIHTNEWGRSEVPFGVFAGDTMRFSDSFPKACF